jgi:phosphoribosylglycinamide formyltransferase-1
MTGPPVRLGILLSGRGSNFLALHEAVLRGELPARIALVASNVASAPGITAAQERGLPVCVLPPAEAVHREQQEAALLEALRRAQVEWVCLAGYMRVLSAGFVTAYRQRIANIHPSLLPAFPGLHAQRQAFAHGVRVAGCTVHLVDEGLDSGPIVGQEAVEVRDSDDLETLTARILAAEHRLYPRAMRRLLTEPWELQGRRLVFSAGSTEADPPGGCG